ncbi:Rna polymerase II [Blastocladiella britannica]|nr:Rna polymerase II [Blastocladiella britannica]
MEYDPSAVAPTSSAYPHGGGGQGYDEEEDDYAAYGGDLDDADPHRYGAAGAGGAGDGDFDDDDDPLDDQNLTDADVWTVIDSFFDTNGLVSQQTDSFDDFIGNHLQGVVDGQPPLVLQTTPKYSDGVAEARERYTILFGAMSIAKPTLLHGGVPRPLYPHETRMRGLTYVLVKLITLRCVLMHAFFISYTADIMLDMTVQRHRERATWVETDGEDQRWAPIGGEEVHNQMKIGKLPIMVGSKYCSLHNLNPHMLAAVGECAYDKGGYFIINGSEKVLIAQERTAANTVFVFSKGKGAYHAEIRSQSESGSQLSSFIVRWNARDKRITCSLPYIADEIDLAIVLRALGMQSDRQMLEVICYDMADDQMFELLKPSIEHATVIGDHDSALDFIGRRGRNPAMMRDARIRYASDLVEREMLPHIGTSPGYLGRKAYFVGYMVHKMLLVALGRRPVDDRDHFGKKRLDMSGPLLAGLFKTFFTKFTKDLQRKFNIAVENGRSFQLEKSVSEGIITNGMKYALATGNWGDQKKFMESRAGVSQVLNRYTFASTLSHLRRLNTPIGRDGKIAKPRQLHNTHWGMVCPAETPEGQACGLVKNLSLMAYISVGTPAEPIRDTLYEHGVEDLAVLSAADVAQGTKVLVNGAWIGIHREPGALYNALRGLRRIGSIHAEASIVRDMRDNELRIYTDAGRIMRPLFIVDELTQRLTLRTRLVEELRDFTANWDTVLQSGAVEYMDTEEEEMVMICMSQSDLRESRGEKIVDKAANGDRTARLKSRRASAYCKQWSHCEIHPSMILGICASIVPFPDHNQSPRNTYQSAMGKQAMGVYLTNFALRMDTLANLLYYPQQPLVATSAMKYLRFAELPAGQNAIVAISVYSGYNQEDSIIMNQSSIDRGLFRSIYSRTYVDSEAVKMGPQASFERPTRESTMRLRRGDYDLLDVDGLVPPGTQVKGEDIIMGKTAPLPQDVLEMGARTTQTKRDVSTALKSTERGYVDQVVVTTNADGLKSVKVRVRSTRVPQMGDKFASRHGQKGTVGMTYRQEDMLFSAQGVTPDLVVNPHAIPSRMTIGHLVECLLSKVGSLVGTMGDATPFTDLTVQEISQRLAECGYQQRGFEIMYNGHTGKKLDAQVFFGPTYYQRLKHMVDDKIHSRARGPMQIMTRQPVEGRSRDGGLRFGEMERDCFIAHGAAQFLKDRLFDNSDAYRVHVCDQCGLFAISIEQPGTGTKQYLCRACNNTSKISQVYMPYAAKLLFQELMSMNIAPRLVLSDRT